MTNDPAMTLETQLSAAERDLLARLISPRAIQDFLDDVEYEAEYFNRAPLRVLPRTARALLRWRDLRGGRTAPAWPPATGARPHARAVDGR